jgi:epoxyqueuosine reductase
MPDPEVTRDEVFAAVLGAGAVAVGVCGVEVLEEARDTIRRRRSAGLHDGMAFTYRNPERSTDPKRALPSAQSAVVAAFPYRTQRCERPDAAVAEVSRYAAEDTYGALRAALGAGAEVLRDRKHRAVVLADDNALVDRSLAVRAGLGWLGKNTNLLVPGVGSWVVIGSILIDTVLPASSVLPGKTGLPGNTGSQRALELGCGSCTRCMTACPTGALVAPGVMDSSRCLSWLLQRTGEFPRRFRVALGARIYGCDDCQEACPPSRPSISVHTGSREVRDRSQSDGAPLPPGDWVELADLLTMTDEALLERFGAWYIPKRDPRYLRRNALVVLGNLASDSASPRGGRRRLGTTDVRGLLRRYLADEDPLLVQHAAWAARRACVDDLLDEEPWRTHPEVLAERARPHPQHEVQHQQVPDQQVPDHEPLLAAVVQHRETGPDVPS